MAETRQGAPCKRGHTEQYVSNGNCVECNKLWNINRRRKRHAVPLGADPIRYRTCVELGNRLLATQWGAPL